MISIIEQIYNGERGFFETIKASEEYIKILDKVDGAYKQLNEQLNEEQKKLFADFIALTHELESESILTHYKEGFKIGLLMGMEVNE